MKTYLVEILYQTTTGAQRTASLQTEGKTNHEAHFKAVELVKKDKRRRAQRLIQSVSYCLEPVLQLKHG